jgi:cytochrome oxidase Cu insertion factor (SCO1/SenC/PrrC family)
MELTHTHPARPGWLGRLVGRPSFWVVAVALLFGVPLGRSLLRRVPPAPPVLGTLPAFALTDQEGRAFGTRELRGQVWVADFIFTSCQGSCPLLSQKMAEVAKRARQLGPEFHLVSLTVDPERDTPARLAEYAGHYGANPRKWSFLTGAMGDIQGAVTDGFKIGMGREKNGDFWEIFHGEHLVLVDRQLRIRGYFAATAEGLDRLMDAISSVINGA